MDFGGGVEFVAPSSPATQEALKYLGKYGPFVFSGLLLLIGLVSIVLVGRRVRQRMSVLCGEGWEKEWYNYVDVQETDPVVRRYNKWFIWPGQLLYLLGYESILLGWSKAAFEVSFGAILVSVIASSLFGSRVVRWWANRAKARAEKTMEKPQMAEEKEGSVSI